MYQRSLNFCKQPVVVVVDVILLTEIAETYGLRQEKGLITGWDVVPPGPTASCLWQDVSDSYADAFFPFIKWSTTWLTTQLYLTHDKFPSSSFRKKTLKWYQEEWSFMLACV